MPYIITTHYDGAIHPQASTPERPNPTAVATLDEARGAVLDAARRATGDARARGAQWAEVPESGGTVGPLPDGTVIEVRPMLRDDVTMTAGENRYIAGMTADEMVTAFNAA